MKTEDIKTEITISGEDSERKIALEDSMSKHDPAEGTVRKYALDRIECLEEENRHLVETIMKNDVAINVYREMADLLEIEEEKQ